MLYSKKLISYILRKSSIYHGDFDKYYCQKNHIIDEFSKLIQFNYFLNNNYLFAVNGN
ncbi:orphan [Acanthamoeba polyphaga mimivirus]|nr:orphan [Mimivirus reunion]WMV61806.1 orphan [Mimivirus sp.]WMV62783.1 orphan [Acanthamoeba polyphaga mimivirus]WMV63760.1 orphan [Mimivirus sp.]